MQTLLGGVKTCSAIQIRRKALDSYEGSSFTLATVRLSLAGRTCNALKESSSLGAKKKNPEYIKSKMINLLQKDAQIRDTALLTSAS